MPLKSEAIKSFLIAHTHQDLSSLYFKGMETQVNVAQDNGKLEDIGKLGGKPIIAYTDGNETWKTFRIPAKAMSAPEDNDGEVGYNLDEHVEGIGMTGWDWQNKVSKWVAYDFDAMLGHSEKHAKKLTDTELLKVQQIVTGLPYVTIRKSTSGRGLHLYVFLNDIKTENHTEHAALARSILSMIAGLTGYDFTDKVDICGGVMWVWHRKMKGTEGLKLIKAGVPLEKLPDNWKDHVPVVNKSANRVKINVDLDEMMFNELSGQRSKITLDDDHLKLINYLNDNNLRGWWDSDNHTLVTHTSYLAKAHKDLGLRGEFHTNASGKDFGHDINCFAFPCRNGVWAVRRYGVGTGEHKIWVHEPKGYTRIFFNRQPTLDDLARLHDGIELERGGFQFASVAIATLALQRLNIDLRLPEWIQSRPVRVKELTQEYKISVTIRKESNDQAGDMSNLGWLAEKEYFKRLFNNLAANVPDESISLGDYDNIVRHIINEVGTDMGWMVCTDTGIWREEPINHVRMFLTSQGIGKKDVELILGRCVAQPWKTINKPFDSEYPGDRRWNRTKARLSIAPSVDGETLSYPTWQSILDHCGESLNSVLAEHPWAKLNNIKTGGDYLKLWFTCLLKHPDQPLPYLALYGPQDSGKSTLHEAFCTFILAGGFMDGNLALNSTSNFNGELLDCVLATLEETDLRRKEVLAKMKDWVTSPLITIHIKGFTPYRVKNYTHWIQCVNDRANIPAFDGDKRITMLYVHSLKHLIPKRDLAQLLAKEAPDFLSALLSTEIPDSRDRLMLPVIQSADKLQAELDSMTPVEAFWKKFVKEVDGAFEVAIDVYSAFKQYVSDTYGPEEVHKWSLNKFAREHPTHIVRGRIAATKSQAQCYGNITLNLDTPPEPSARWINQGTVSLVRVSS